jgi:hypothetical protein
MTCRSLLWITAAAVSVGAAASTPSIAAAQTDGGWTITIDAPATEVVDSKHLRIEGTVSTEAAAPTPLENLTVTVVPQGLPGQCSPASGPATLDGDRYAIELDVDCNGPHEIQVAAQGSSAEPLTIGVAEPPPEPAPPILDLTSEGGLKATWDPTNDPDGAGSILVVNFREDHYAAGIVEAILPPSDRRASVARRALRWGAGGPGTTVSSRESGGNVIGESNPNEPNNPEPPPPSPPEPPAATPLPTPAGPSSTGPPSANADTTTPIPSTPATTLPAGEEKPPSGALDTALISRSEPDWRPSPHGDERAIESVVAPSGLVHTTDQQPPRLIAPLALALLIITIATHITWQQHRRSRDLAGTRPSSVHGSGTRSR